MQKKIGMVIVNYNDYEMTSHLLNNIKEYKCFEKIVVVDNNSSDNSFEKLKAFTSKKIIIIKNKSRKYCSGLNVGAKKLIKELGKCNIIFSNSDIIIDSEEDIKSICEADNLTGKGESVEGFITWFKSASYIENGVLYYNNSKINNYGGLRALLRRVSNNGKAFNQTSQKQNKTVNLGNRDFFSEN